MFYTTTQRDQSDKPEKISIAYEIALSLKKKGYIEDDIDIFGEVVQSILGNISNISSITLKNTIEFE